MKHGGINHVSPSTGRQERALLLGNLDYPFPHPEYGILFSDTGILSQPPRWYHKERKVPTELPALGRRVCANQSSLYGKKPQEAGTVPTLEPQGPSGNHIRATTVSPPTGASAAASPRPGCPSNMTLPLSHACPEDESRSSSQVPGWGWGLLSKARFPVPVPVSQASHSSGLRIHLPTSVCLGLLSHLLSAAALWLFPREEQP